MWVQCISAIQSFQFLRVFDNPWQYLSPWSTAYISVSSSRQKCWLARYVLACESTMTLIAVLGNLRRTFRPITFSFRKRTSSCVACSNHKPSIDMLAWVSKITPDMNTGSSWRNDERKLPTNDTTAINIFKAYTKLGYEDGFSIDVNRQRAHLKTSYGSISLSWQLKVGRIIKVNYLKTDKWYTKAVNTKKTKKALAQANY